MEKMKSILSWCIPVVLIAVALVSATSADAKTIKIWPDQLKPLMPFDGGSPEGYYQNAFELRNGGFYFPLNLPVGTRITKVTAYLQGYNGETSTVSIIRVKMEAYEDSFGYLADGFSSDSTGTVIPVDIEIVGDPIIKAGYRYSILLRIPDEQNILRGITITYQQ
jgi:hypothetical protein